MNRRIAEKEKWTEKKAMGKFLCLAAFFLTSLPLLAGEYTIDDFKSYTYAGAQPIGSFETYQVVRKFDGIIRKIKVTIVEGDADDIGYVGGIQVTDTAPQCARISSVIAPVDVTSQVTVEGDTASFTLAALENCCCVTGWGSATHPSRKDAKFHWQVELACRTCSDNPGCTQISTGSVNMTVGLGSIAHERSAGELYLKEDALTPASATPANLKVNVASGVTVKQDEGGILRQVQAPQVLADVLVVSSYKYEIRLYGPSEFGTLDPSGFYQPAGAPFKKIVVENPDGENGFNRLKIIEVVGSSSTAHDFEYSAATRQWTLVTGNGARREIRSSIVDEGTQDRVETFVVQNPDGTTASKQVTTFHTFSWGEEKIRETVDPDGAALITTWVYYADQATDGFNYGHLRQVVRPNGGWERYEYDARQQPTKVVSSFLNAPPEAPENVCHVRNYAYSNSWQTVTETLMGQEVARNYRRTTLGEVREIQCQKPGAEINDEDNLITVTRYFTYGDFKDEVQRIQHPDGTMTFYTYAYDGDQKITTVKTGHSVTGNDVRDGIQTVTIVDKTGNRLLETTSDVLSGLLLSSAMTTQFDEFGRPTRVEYSDGTFETFAYGCCGIESQKDREGIATSYLHDDLKRPIAVTRAGMGTFTEYDAEGRILKTIRKGTDNSEIITNRSTYNLAGRLTSSKDALDHLTGYSEIIDGSGHTVRTITFPDGSTRIETFAKDGSLLSITGTAVHPVSYEYGADADSLWTREIRIGTNGAEAEWIKTCTDMAGRLSKTITSAGAVTQNFYNNKNQLIKQVDPDGVTTLYQYNRRGELEYTVVEMFRNDRPDFDWTDRITRVQNQVVTTHGTTVRQTTTTIWTTEASTNTVVAAINEISADGLQSWNTTYGLTTHSQTAYDPANARRTVTTTAPDGAVNTAVYQQGRLVSSITQHPSLGALSSLAIIYDGHGRQISSTDARGIQTSTAYNAADQLTSQTITGNGVPPQTTSFLLDSMGRRTRTTLSDGGMVYYEYFSTGELKKTWGARTYPVEYGHDTQGRLKTLTTWKDFSGNAGTATTTWNYDPASGFLTSKIYADGHGPSYTYTPAGRLSSRAWARGIITTYSYNEGGEVVGIDYSDSTPDVTFILDRLGRQTSASSVVPVPPGAGSAVNYSFNDAGQPLTETWTSGPLAGVQVSHAYDPLLRRSSVAFRSLGEGGPILTSHTFDYDPASRLQTVTSGNHSASYNYLPNSLLVSGITFRKNGATVMTTSKQFDGLNRLTQISSLALRSLGEGGSVVTSHSYQYNTANQRTRVNIADSGQNPPGSGDSYWVYQYDDLGQVISGKKFWADSTLVAGQQFDYAFDTIGNRTTAKKNTRESIYSANPLNQYKERTVPGFVDILGAASTNATVTVNLEPVERKEEYFRKELAVENATSAAYPEISVVGVKNLVGPNGEDAVTEEKGHLFIPKTPEQFVHDADGNLTSDGRWQYSWDAENRLIAMETHPSVSSVVPKQRLEFAHDHQGRRIQKKLYIWGSGAWAQVYDHRFVYDNWNLLAELNANITPFRTFTWGQDLSGTLQGAGGVGGLLTVSNVSDSTIHFSTFDGNGNVIALVNAAEGKVSAEYSYGPFAEQIQASGPMAKVNPFRFSTKYTDNESGLVYYGYRYLNASTGRWLSRDPIEEEGGLNLFGFCANDPVNLYDGYGLAVHLAPLNGEAENHSASATATIQGDWAILTFTKGATTVVKYPWSEAGRLALLAYYGALPGWSSTETIGSGTHSLGPGKGMAAEWTAGATRIVDSDFLNGATKTVYEDDKCCKKATLPVKIGWNVLNIYDCPSGIDGVYYKK